MSYKNCLPILAILAGCAISSTSNARPQMAVALRGGTPGLGLEYNVNIVSRLNARVGYSAISLSPSYEITDDEEDPDANAISYDIELKMNHAFGLVDWYAFNGRFRITLGGVSSKTTLDITAKPTTGIYEFGDGSYSASSIDSVSGQIKIGDGISPYVGIGWGNPLDTQGRWKFMVDIGAINAGKPKATLVAQCAAGLPSAQCTAIQQDALIEQKNLEDDVGGTEWYPAINVGIGYRF